MSWRWTFLAMTLPCLASAAPQLTLSPFASGFDELVGFAQAGDSRLFALEKKGTIRIVTSTGTVEPTPFLDLTGRVWSSGEGGVLGLAFHPSYATNGLFYVHYTSDLGGLSRSRISRFSVTFDPDVANPASEVILLTVDHQPYHNAGWIGFGPDGYLYIPFGDGASSATAQDPGSALGKVLRIDVDSSAGGSAPDCSGAGSGSYLVPPGNPFVDGAGGTCDEIWSIGFRNPWRGSFDRLTGDLWIGDVGESSWEEVDLVAAGENHGWRCYEGPDPYDPTGCGPIDDYSFPVFAYNIGCAIIGGYVYRGTQYPALDGIYVCADFCTGYFWMLENVLGSWIATRQNNLMDYGYAAFGESASGELFVANYDRGTILQVGSEPVPVELTGFTVE